MPRFALLVVGAALLLSLDPSQGRAEPAKPAPSLVVLVIVDQMRADYLADFHRQWSRGLRTLSTRGAVFLDATYPYLNTVTCPGHATIGTGAFPSRHGMINNTWWALGQNKPVDCTADPESPTIFYGPPQQSPGHSARNLEVPTLAEVMRQTLKPAPRVVSFAGKARSAIAPVGKGADLVVWYEGDGSWATSRAFAAGPSPLVERVLAGFDPAKAVTRPWRRLLPAQRYRFPDEGAGERLTIPWWDRQFPHRLAPRAVDRATAEDGTPLPLLAAWDRSPMPDELVLRLAREALDEMALGQGAGTDLLSLGLSALDVVGHAFGPRSHEVQDTLARLDRLLGELLALLDRKPTRGRYVLALTSDHGVAAHPEQLIAEGEDAGRVPLIELRSALEQAIAKEIGPGKHVAAVYYTDIYLAPGVPERLRAKPGALERILGLIRQSPGVAAAFSGDQLKDAAALTDPLARAAALSYFPGRSGQLVLVPRPNWLTTREGTTHGSTNRYDQHVPMMLYGSGVRPGRYPRGVTPADIAPTLAALLGLTLPQADGRPLTEALQSR